MQNFRPGKAPSDPRQLPEWLDRQMLGIQRAAQDANDSVNLRKLAVEPTRPQDGGHYNADGTNWDPGSGAGTYRYDVDATTGVGAFVKVGGASGLITASGLTMNTARLLGRSTASAGAIEEIELGTNLSFTGTTLNAAGGGGAGPTSGGATSTGSVTLTSASKQAQKLGPTTNGDYVKLPDATGCTKGGSLWVLGNPTAYWVRILDNTGVLRGFVAPYTTVEVSLADNSTAAGGWLLDGSALFGITSTLRTSNRSFQVRAQFLDLGSSRTLIVFCTGGTGTISAVVHDASDNTWGSVTLVRTVLSANFNSIIQSTDLAVVVSTNNGTALQAVTLSISGKTITTNTAATDTLAGNIVRIADIILLGAAVVFSYFRASTTQALRAVTISGTTATIGAEVTTSTTGSPGRVDDCPHLYAVSSTVVLAVGAISGASTGFANPYTLSGSTLTLGTGATFGTVINNMRFRTLAMGSGTWLIAWCEGGSGTTLSAALVSVSGTTASVTSVTTVLTGLGGSFDIRSQVDLRAISSTKALVVGRNATSTLKCNLLVDAAGTVSKGTELEPVIGSGNYTSLAILAISGNNARVYVGATAGKGGGVLTLDCSGASPVISSGDFLSPSINPAVVTYVKGSTVHPAAIRCGGGWSFIQSAPTAAINQAVVVGESEVFPLPVAAPFVFAQQLPTSPWITFNPTSRISDYATWHHSENDTEISFFTVNRIEGAQP